MDTTHTPWPTLVDIVEDVGGVYIAIDQEIQLRCGCRDDLLYDYGHAKELATSSERVKNQPDSLHVPPLNPGG